MSRLEKKKSGGAFLMSVEVERKTMCRARYIIQITTNINLKGDVVLHALCNDGSLWSTEEVEDAWHKMDIRQIEQRKEKVIKALPVSSDGS